MRKTALWVIVSLLVLSVIFLLGYWISGVFLKNKSEDNVVFEKTKEENILINAGSLENDVEKVNYVNEAFSFNEGKLSLFFISPAYQFKLRSITKLNSSTIETIWEFFVGERSMRFKVLSTECALIRDLDGESVVLGNLKVKEGDVLAPKFSGIDRSFEDDAFILDAPLSCREVWGKLEVYDGLTDELKDYFSKGNIAAKWETDELGVLDLTDKLTLIQANKAEYVE